MKLIFCSIFLFAISAQASDLIKTFDGKVARCKSKVDVVTHSFSPVYRPISLKKHGQSADLKIEFLSCVEEDGAYKFVREANLESKVVTSLLRPEMSYQLDRSEFSLVAITGNGELVDNQALEKNADGTYTVLFSTQALEYDPSPVGKKSFEIFIQMKVRMENLTLGGDVERYLESLGTYRLVI